MEKKSKSIKKTRLGGIKAICPYCGAQAYTSPNADPSDELAAYFALGLHTGKCLKNPSYGEDEFDKHLSDLGIRRHSN